MNFFQAVALAHSVVEYVAISLDLGQLINDLEISTRLAKMNQVASFLRWWTNHHFLKVG